MALFGSSSALGASSPSPFAGVSSTSNPFGTTSSTPFGSNQNTSLIFGSSTFGSQSGTSLFGGTATGVFGATQASTSTFGALPAPAFGSSLSAFRSGTSVFGQKPTTPFGGFGSTFGQVNPFGSSAFVQSQPAFGSTSFGSSAPAFGSTTPSFALTPYGTRSMPAFGATSTPAIGAASTPAFGAASTPAFGASSSLAFGASASPAFGSLLYGSSTPAFGQATSTFGNTSLPSFGSTSMFGSGGAATAFGTQSTPAFGAMASLVTAALEVQEDPVIIASKDLLIIGPGVLGKLVAGLWMKEFPGCSVVGQTATTNHHGELQSLGIRPLLKGNQSDKGFPFVVFCAPPSGSLDYVGELRLAAEQWNGQGVLLFTSSSAVYDCADSGECDEDTPIVNLGWSPRTDVLLRAEKEVLQVGGTVVRFAGLYTKERGPHAYWAKKGIVDARPDHILNLIHYEDAASLCVTILKKGFQKEVFMGCDNHPLSRQEVMNIVNESGKFEDKFEAFTGIDGPLGKKMNCDRTRSKTGWQPKHKSFAEFIHFVA